MIDSTARDYEKIFEELKRLAKEYSDGRWTDFTDGDFGTVIIHLLSYVGDLLSNQIDTTANELFLFTAEERTSLMEIAKLVGYEPRHFLSSMCRVDFTTSQDIVIPAWAKFSGSGFTFHSLTDQSFVTGDNSIYVYEGDVVKQTFSYDDIDENGQINLKDYYVAFNTVSVDLVSGSLSGRMEKVADARFNVDGGVNFSCHLGLEGYVYLQFPSYWRDLFSNSSKIYVTYLRCHGSAGNVESNIISTIDNQVSEFITINSQTASIGGMSPETVAEMKLNTMAFARTMYTLVTKKDFEDLSRFIPSIATLRALDYLDEESGYIQPTPPNGYPNDAYKVKLVVVPFNPNSNSIWYTKEDGTTDLTEVGYDVKNFVDDKRLATLYIDYEDPTYIVPDIILYLYMDENNIRVNAISKDIVDFIKEFFGRTYTKIGQSIRGSVIGKQVLNYFSDVDYLNIDTTIVKENEGEEEGFEFDIKAGPLDFIDMANAAYTVYVNDTLQYVPDGSTIKRLVLGESVDLSIDGKYNFAQYYVSEEDYKKNNNLVVSGVKALWEEDGRKMVLTVPDDMLSLIDSDTLMYKGVWDSEVNYGSDNYVFYNPSEDYVFQGVYSPSVSYKENDYVFKDGYYYVSVVDNNKGNAVDGSSWSKMHCFYRSLSDFNVENIPTDVEYWVEIDPYI